MSWKKYGGIHQLNQNSITVNSIATDKISFRGVYDGNFDVCGLIHSSGNLQTDSDCIVLGNAYVYHNANIFHDLDVYGNATVHGNIIANDKLFMGDITGNTYLNRHIGYFYGVSGNIGVNTINPASDFDIHGSRSNVLSIISDTSYNYNIISQNVNNRGIVVTASDLSSGILFYNDVSINNANTFDAAIIYDACLNSLYFDISNDLQIHSGMIITHRQRDSHNSNLHHIRNEPVTIYDNAVGPFLDRIYPVECVNTGDSLFLCSQDNSSNTFIKMVTPSGIGLAVGGGAYPDDTSRPFGVLGLIDNSNNYINSQTIVQSQNYNSKYNIPITLGINTYSPATDIYSCVINGPTHFENNNISSALVCDFQISCMRFCANLPNIGIILGSPNVIPPGPFVHNHFITLDSGISWKPITITNSSNDDSDITLTSVNLTDAYIYDIDTIFAVGGIYKTQQGGFIYFTNDQGATWHPILTDSASFIGPLTGITIITLNASVVFAFVISNAQYQYATYQFYYANIVPKLNNDIISPLTFYPVYTGLLQPKSIANYSDRVSGNNFILVCGAGGLKVYSVNTNNVILVGLLGSIFSTTPPSLYGDSGAGKNCIHNTFNYNSMCVYDLQHILLVGTDTSNNYFVITRVDNIFNDSNWTNIRIDTNPTSVHIYDSMRAMVVCDGGVLFYSIDGYYNWKRTTIDSFNPFVNSPFHNNSQYHFTNIFIKGPNEFLVTKTLSNYDIDLPQLGSSELYYCYLPELLNKSNNYVIDISGNMEMSGDLHINDRGKLMSNNDAMYVFNDTVKNIYIGSDTSGIYIGNPIDPYATTFILDRLDVSRNIYARRNVDISRNLNVLGNTYLWGNTIVAHDFAVSGNTILRSNLDCSNNVVIHGNLTVYKDIIFYGNFDLGKETNLYGNLYCDKNSYFNGNTYTNRIIQGNSDLKIMGNTYLYGNVFMKNDLNLSGNLHVLFDTILSGNVQVNGDVSFNRPVFFANDISINGNLHVGKNTFIDGAFSIDSLKLSGNLLVNGQTIMNGPMQFNGDMSLNGNIYIDKDMIIPGMLTVKGFANFDSGLVANKNVTLMGKVNSQDDFNCNKNLNVNGVITASGELHTSTINAMFDCATNQYITENYLYANRSSTKNIYFGSTGDKIYMNADVVYRGSFTTSTTGVAETAASQFFLNSVSGEVGGANQFPGSSAGGGLFLQDNGNSQQGYMIISDDLTGFNFKATTFNGAVPQNVVKMDVARLTINNPANSDELMILRPASAYQPTFGQTDADYSYNMVSSGLSINSIFVRNQALSSSNNQFIDTDMTIAGNFLGLSDISANGNLYAQNNAAINGSLLVNLDSSFNGNLFVNNNTTMNGKLIVISDTSLNSNLKVGLNTYLNGSLQVTGKTKLTNDVSLNGFMDINSNGCVTRFLPTKVFISNDLSLNGRFYCQSNSYLYGSLLVNGGTNLNSSLTVGSDASLNSKLKVGGDVSLNSKLFVNGSTHLNSDLTVTGALYALNDTSLNGSLCVNNDTSLNSNLLVGLNTTLNNNLNVGESAYINGDMSINSTLTVNSNTYLLGVTTTEDDVYINGKLTTENISYLNSDVYIGGLTNTCDINAVGSLNLAGTATVGGFVTLNNFVTQNLAGSNIQYGYSSLNMNTTGSGNASFGYQTLMNNINGSYNCAMGYNSLQQNTNGTNNTAIGTSALFNNITGNLNVAIGGSAGYSSTTGIYNTFLGYAADTYNGTYSYSTAIGYNSRITGNNLIVLGTAADVVVSMGDASFNGNVTINRNLIVGSNMFIQGNITSYNTINTVTLNSTYVGNVGNVLTGNIMVNAMNIGDQTAPGNLNINGFVQQTVGSPINNNLQYGYGALISVPITSSGVCTNNMALGFNSLNAMQSGTNNISIGNYASLKLNGGYDNVTIGFSTLKNAITNSVFKNIAIGSNVLSSLTSGNNILAIGYNSGSINTNYGSNNTLLGAQTDVSGNTGYQNSTALGYGSIITANNQVMLGRSTETVTCPGALLVSGTSVFNSPVTFNFPINQVFGSSNLQYGTSALQYASANPSVVQDNMAMGIIALQQLTNGIQNVALANYSLSKLQNGANNISVGTYTLSNLTGGSYNIAIGTKSLFALNVTNANENVSIGYNSAQYLNGGSSNVFIGSRSCGTTSATIAGDSNRTQIYGNGNNYNTLIGANSELSGNFAFPANYTYSTALGYGSIITSSNQIMLGRTTEFVCCPGTQDYSTSSPNVPCALNVSGGMYVAKNAYFGGIVYATTLAAGTNSTALATTSFVGTAVSTASSAILAIINSNGGMAYLGATQTFTGLNTFTNKVVALSFNATSDYRSKTNIIELDDSYSIDQLRPVAFNFKDNLKEAQIGFIAHETQEHYPYLVSGDKDGEDLQSLNYTSIIGMLVKEIQNMKQKMSNMQKEIDILMNT